MSNINGQFIERRLVKHINKLNADSQKLMDENPGLFIGNLTNDPEHWFGYGIYSPAQLDYYLNAEAEINIMDMERE